MRTQHTEQLPQANDDNKNSVIWRLQDRLRQLMDIESVSSSLDERYHKHFKTTETTWAEALEHAPHQDPGMIWVAVPYPQVLEW